MKMSFNKDVRKSLAEELKKVGILGPPLFAFLFPDGDPYVKSVAIVASVFWFITIQACAHVLLAMEDDEPENTDVSPPTK